MRDWSRKVRLPGSWGALPRHGRALTAIRIAQLRLEQHRSGAVVERHPEALEDARPQVSGNRSRRKSTRRGLADLDGQVRKGKAGHRKAGERSWLRHHFAAIAAARDARGIVCPKAVLTREIRG